jgi:acyl-coenzyme A thioesterase PaaI-like protein
MHVIEVCCAAAVRNSLVISGVVSNVNLRCAYLTAVMQGGSSRHDTVTSRALPDTTVC